MIWKKTIFAIKKNYFFKFLWGFLVLIIPYGILMAWLTQEVEREENRLNLAGRQTLLQELNKFHRRIAPENFLTEALHEYEKQNGLNVKKSPKELTFIPGQDPRLINDNFLPDLKNWLAETYSVKLSFAAAANCDYRQYQYEISAPFLQGFSRERLKTFARVLLNRDNGRPIYWYGPRSGTPLDHSYELTKLSAETWEDAFKKIGCKFMGEFWNNGFYNGRFFRSFTNNLGGQKIFQFRRVISESHKNTTSVLGSYVLFILSSDVPYQRILHNEINRTTGIQGLEKRLVAAGQSSDKIATASKMYLESVLPEDFNQATKGRKTKVVFSLQRPRNDNRFKFYRKIAFTLGLVLLFCCLAAAKQHLNRNQRIGIKVRWKLSAIIGLIIFLPILGISFSLVSMNFDARHEFSGKVKANLDARIQEFSFAIKERVLNRFLFNTGLKDELIRIYSLPEKDRQQALDDLKAKGDSIDQIFVFSHKEKEISTKRYKKGVNNRLYSSLAKLLFYNWNGKMAGGKKLSPLVMDVVDSFWAPFQLSKKLSKEGLETGVLEDVSFFKRMMILYYVTFSASGQNSNLDLICFMPLHSITPFYKFFQHYVEKNIAKFNYWHDNCEFTYAILALRTLGKEDLGWPSANVKQLNISPEIAQLSNYMNEGTQIFSQQSGKTISAWKKVPIANILVAGKVFIPADGHDNEVIHGVIFLLLFFGILLSVIAGDFLSYVFLEPVKTLEKASKQIGQANFSLNVELGETREFALVGRAFNLMTAALRQRERLKTFVPKRLSEEVTGVRQRAATTEGEWLEAVILSSDIRSFTTLTEKTPPQELVAGINSYYEEMQREIEKHSGMILKIIGDAILAAYFSEPGMPCPAERSVASARDMIASLKKWNEKRRLQKRFTLQNGVGLAMGEVLACKLGIEGGRMEFTVIGESMQRANDLEAMSATVKETSIVAGENLVKHLASQEIIGPANASKTAWKIKE
jgi:class 3 adenylate cyclase